MMSATPGPGTGTLCPRRKHGLLETACESNTGCYLGAQERLGAWAANHDRR